MLLLREIMYKRQTVGLLAGQVTREQAGRADTQQKTSFGFITFVWRSESDGRISGDKVVLSNGK